MADTTTEADFIVGVKAKSRAELEAEFAHAIEQRDRALGTLRERVGHSERALNLFKQSVTDTLKEFVDNGTFDLRDAKSFAVEVDVPVPTKKFDVKVMIEIVIEGVSADDEDDAASKAREGLDVSVNLDSEHDTDSFSHVAIEVTEV